MTFGVPAEPYEVNPIIENAMRRIFILHADHEQNASTSTVRLAGSSGANPFACIAAGIACLWGPAHGGANEAALNMLREIGNVKRIPEYIARAKDKDDPFRLMGFGHRVYKNFDPRAKVMKATADEVLKELNISDPVLDVAKELEHIALNDAYFIEKKLYPNVDFYSGVILNAIGFPTDMFTALFALARTVGWVAQWNEMIADPEQKIGRPRQLYVGATQRDYVAGRQALGDGQRQREARALAGRAFQRDVAAHRSGQTARDRKAQAGSAGLRLDALEALEDALLVGGSIPGPCRQPSPKPLPASGRRPAAPSPPSGEWRTALPIRLTRIWITARSCPLRGRTREVELDGDAALFGERSTITTASAVERGEVDRAVALRRILAHRADDRQQVPRGGGYVVAIARIIAAQRAVGALDDPLGTFDDSIDRRAKHLVQCVVESGARERVRRWCAGRSMSAESRGSRRSFRRRRSTTSPLRHECRLRRCGSRARWPVNPRRPASALISGISPAHFLRAAARGSSAARPLRQRRRRDTRRVRGTER